MNLQDTINQINQLQVTEKKLYDSLTDNAERVALGQQAMFSQEDITTITEQINSLSSARVTLYNTLSELYQSVHANDTIMKDSIKQQTETLELLEKELNASKQKMDAIEESKLNHLKMIEITTYYSKHYDAQKQLMKIMTGIGIALFISVYFQLSMVTFIIIILAIIWIGYRVILMYMRTNTNYDEFNFMDPENSSSSSSPSFSTTLTAPSICVESACCSKGTTWDTKLGCISKK